MFAHNRLGKGDANRTYTESDSPGVESGATCDVYDRLAGIFMLCIGATIATGGEHQYAIAEITADVITRETPAGNPREVPTMDSSVLDEAADSQLPCDVGTDLVFPVTFTSPASYLVTTFRLYSTFCIAFMVSRKPTV